MMSEKNTPTVRPLHNWEILEAWCVFADQIDYRKVRIHESASWPDAIDRAGQRLRGQKPPSISHNAITLGNHIFFPVRLLASPVPAKHADRYLISWLMHEMTHVWQYQHMGWRYLLIALNTQLRQGREAYSFGGENGLNERLRMGHKLANFNLEQQGDIARSYYDQLCDGKAAFAWRPFIAQIQRTDSQVGGIDHHLKWPGVG
jgi:hypothetical protein